MAEGCKQHAIDFPNMEVQFGTNLERIWNKFGTASDLIE